MKTRPSWMCFSALTLAGLAACSSTPPTNPSVEAARSSLNNAQRDPMTQGLGGRELGQATEAVQAAEAALAADRDTTSVEHLAYLAQQRVSLLLEAGSKRAAEAAVAQAQSTRESLRLNARTLEAERAQRSAQNAQASAQAAQGQAQDAQRQARGLQRLAVLSQVQATEAEQRAGALESQLRELKAKKTDRGLVNTIGDVLFDNNRAELKPGADRGMDKVAGFMKAYPLRKAMIEGFTDSVGSEEHNQALSDRRAEAVRGALVGMGVGMDRLATHGFGEAFPVAGNDSASGRQMNRRVEIVLSDDGGVINPR